MSLDQTPTEKRGRGPDGVVLLLAVLGYSVLAHFRPLDGTPWRDEVEYSTLR